MVINDLVIGTYKSGVRIPDGRFNTAPAGIPMKWPSGRHTPCGISTSENRKKGIINIFDYKSGNTVSVDTSCRSVNYLQAVGDGYVIGCNSNRVFVIKNGCMELERSFPTIRLGSKSRTASWKKVGAIFFSSKR